MTATGGTGTLNLPIALNLAEPKAAKVTLEPKLPALRGTPRSNFDFQVTIKNEGADDQLFNLIADSQGGLETTFSEQYGTQELTSIPVKAGESKDLKVSVKLPQDAAAGQYPVMIEATGAKSSAETELLLDVTGLPSLALVGPEGRLSGEATAGQERNFTFTLKNTGTAPAKDVKLTANAPAGWKVTFDQAEIAMIAPSAVLEVTAAIAPAEKAIAGDYVVSLRAGGEVRVDRRRFPRHGPHLDAVGHRRPRRDRRRGHRSRGRRHPLWPPMSETVIAAKGLTKVYGSVPAVDGLDLVVEAGEVFGILGPNGSGKTTTLLMLLGLTEPTGGSVGVLGLIPCGSRSRSSGGSAICRTRSVSTTTSPGARTSLTRRGSPGSTRWRAGPASRWPWTVSALDERPTARLAAIHAACASASGSPRC